jgi:hypothetical protein
MAFFDRELSVENWMLKQYCLLKQVSQNLALDPIEEPQDQPLQLHICSETEHPLVRLHDKHSSDAKDHKSCTACVKEMVS